MNLARRVIPLLLAASAAGCAPPTDKPAPASATAAVALRGFVVRGAVVFDGERRTSGDVWVSGVRILAVGPRPEGEPEGAYAVIDGKGKTLLPGLVDAHVHAGNDEGNLAQALAFGVTTELDMFGPPPLLRSLRGREEAAELADLRGAGNLATVPGGHGTEYGIPIPTLTRPDEAPAFARARFAEGSDFLKIVLETQEEGYPSLRPDAVAALVGAAHAERRLAVAHVGTQRDAEDAVQAGVDGLMHLFVDSAPRASLVEAVIARRVFVTPTITILKTHCGIAPGAALVGDPRVAPYLSTKERQRLGWTPKSRPEGACLEHVHAAVKLLAGRAPILAGTDAINRGTAHGPSLHGEIASLVDAGLAPEAALAAATSAPARAFRLEDRGRIAPGLVADLVLVDGDATRDVGRTLSIDRVWKRGRAFDRAAFAAKAGGAP